MTVIPLCAKPKRDIVTRAKCQGVHRERHVDIANCSASPKDQVIMTCVAMGYPDDGFPANAVTSDRQPNSDFVRYVGFGD